MLFWVMRPLCPPRRDPAVIMIRRNLHVEVVEEGLRKNLRRSLRRFQLALKQEYHWLSELEAKIFGNKWLLNALLDDHPNWDFPVENELNFILDKSSVSRAFYSF